MKLKGGFSFKIGDISLCLNDSGRKKNDDTGKRIDKSMERIRNGDNIREKKSCAVGSPSYLLFTYIFKNHWPI